MRSCKLILPYLIIDVSLQSGLAKEITELLDITYVTGTQKQQPLFILSLYIMNSFVLDGDWHCVRGKDAISYCIGVESLCAHCDREDVLSLAEASQAADG